MSPIRQRQMRVHHVESDLENHDRGLDYDLPRLIGRRGLLTLAIGAGAATVAGCSIAAQTGSASPASTASSTGSDVDLEQIPEETAGPYPGDGSNGVNVLDDSGIVRSDITTSFDTSTTRADGVPLSITMTILDESNGDAPLSGAAVYLWHCNIDGQYSMYSRSISQENYLRVVQQTDASGQVTFASVFPAAYDGRWPHIHFEVYPSLAQATSSINKIATSQMALPEEACQTVYATSGYEQSSRNLSQTSLDRDNVFGDGYDLQIPTVSGSVTNGLTLEFACSV